MGEGRHGHGTDVQGFRRKAPARLFLSPQIWDKALLPSSTRTLRETENLKLPP